MSSKLLIHGLIVGVAAQVLGFLIHGVVLGADYAKLTAIFRPEAEVTGKLPYLIAAYISMGIAMVCIYRQGQSADQPWLAQGVRFGLAVIALSVLPLYLISYAAQLVPGALVVKQIALDSIATVALGGVTAYLCRQSEQA